VIATLGLPNPLRTYEHSNRLDQSECSPAWNGELYNRHPVDTSSRMPYAAAVISPGTVSLISSAPHRTL
jgi:hypothetical protein